MVNFSGSSAFEDKHRAMRTAVTFVNFIIIGNRFRILVDSAMVFLAYSHEPRTWHLEHSEEFNLVLGPKQALGMGFLSPPLEPKTTCFCEDEVVDLRHE